MLADVGNTKVRFNWVHNRFVSKAKKIERAMTKSGTLDDEMKEVLLFADAGYRARAKNWGTTTCTVERLDTGETWTATTTCHLMEKFYRKERGRTESLEKALESSPLSKEERKAVWASYYKRFGPKKGEVAEAA